MSDVSQQIETSALTPKSVQNGQTKVESRDLKDLIEADKYLAGKNAAANNPACGLRMFKLVPPGAG